MTRTRSEYRLAPVSAGPETRAIASRPPLDRDRDALAVLLLDAYRGSIDDEGEDLDDAYEAIDRILEIIVRDHSFVVVEGEAPVAFSFVVVVDGVHYIDPIVVAPDRKRSGLGRAAVLLSLRSLSRAGVTEVGATITDGNVSSERLFASLGFTRRGAWGAGDGLIRPYRTGDLDGVLEVWYEASLVGHHFLDADFLATEREEIADRWLPLADTIVYELNGRVAGFLSLVGNEVGAVFVHPNDQRRGIGRALLDRARGSRPFLELDVFEANEGGRRFYEAYGFTTIGSNTHAASGQRQLRLRLDRS